MNKINIIIIIKVLGTTPLKLTIFFILHNKILDKSAFQKRCSKKMYVPAQQNNFFIVNLVIALKY